MTGWITLPLGELCRFKAGSAFPQNQQGSTAGDYPFVKVSDLSSSANSKFLNAANNWISADQVATMRPAIAPAGAVLFAKIGEGLRSERCRVATRGTAFDNNLMSAVAIEKNCDPSFLFYLMQTVGLSDYAEGSALPYLKQSVLQKVPCTVPAVYEQRAIAEVLGALDDKIAANSKLAETSSTTSQALFQQLIAASSELTTLGELLNLEYGKALPAAKRAHGHVAVYGSGGVVGAHNEALKDGPGIVVGRKGSAGMVYWSPGPFFPIDTTYYVDPKLGSETLPFCYHVLKSLRLAEMNSDSAVPGLNRAEALATKVQKVDYPAISNFCAAAAPLFELAAEYEQENRTLAATRDALLPQLMSGKLRVKDIEHTMGEMV